MKTENSEDGIERGAAAEFVTPHLVGSGELTAYGSVEDWVSRLAALSRHQREHWPMMAKGYATLSSAQVRRFDFNGFEVRTQFNPGRMTSAAAQVDAKSIQERKCFLCPANLPVEQKGLRYEDYLILCNPFPILDEHFTIAAIEHRPQRIREAFGTFVNLVRDLGEKYTVLYNGPRAGASAPDHLHFQAGTRGWMPIDNEYAPISARFGRELFKSGGARVVGVTDYLRPIIGIEGQGREETIEAFERVYDAIGKIAPADDEPVMNIVGLFDSGAWTVVVFPRAKHRPACFFAEGAEKILVSPGAVDVGGVLITPLPESFDRLSKDAICQVFSEVGMSPDSFLRTCDLIVRPEDRGFSRLRSASP